MGFLKGGVAIAGGDLTGTLPNPRIRNSLIPTGGTYETFPRAETPGITAGGPFATGVIRCSIISLPAGLLVSNINVMSGATPLGTGSNQWFGLFDASRNKLALTSDDGATAWPATTVKTLPIAGGFTTTYSGFYYIGVNVVAVSMPSYTAVSSAVALNTLPPIIAGSGNGSLTNPASCPATLTALTPNNMIFYGYLS